jgi:aminomethyltransferase
MRWRIRSPSVGRAFYSLPPVVPANDLKHTPLYEKHREAGARLVPFAGWEMPVQYAGVKEEHLAVRERCGVFDVSHMGEIETRGPQAAEFLQRLLSNDVGRLDIGGAQYSCLCAEDGGILDDLFTYRLAADRYLTVTNSANHEGDMAWFLDNAVGVEVEVLDAAAAYGMLAVQGPEARAIVGSLAATELPDRMRAGEVEIAGADCLVCGTGYTGEAGVELLFSPADGPALWDRLLAAGAAPAGLGARDTLRLEVCFCLHGNEISPARNPIEAGLGWCCKEETGFVGSESVAAARERGTEQTLVAIAMTGRGVPRGGNELLIDGEPIGELTSGTYSPSLGIGVGMGYVRSDLAAPGTALEIDVRGKRRPAEIRPMPLYEKSN